MNTNIKDRFLKNYKKFEEGSNSYKQYEINIRRLYEYFQEKKALSDEAEIITSISCDDAEDYITDMNNKGYKPNTLNVIMEVSKEYFNYITNKRHMIEHNPFDIVEKISRSDVKASTTEKDTLTVKEIKEIIKASYTRTKGERDFYFSSVRDRFLISLMFVNGIRVSEALAIKMDWIEETTLGTIINIPKEFVKNNIDKRIVIPSSIKDLYKQYILARQEKNLIDDNLLFVTNRGKEMMTSDVNSILEKLTNKAGIDKNITAHCLRHSLTRQLVGAGVSEMNIKLILGWSLGNDITGVYMGRHNEKKYDEMKFKICDLL